MATKANNKDSSTLSESINEESANKIERVRDLILGPQMRDVFQRLEGLGKDVTRIEDELSRLSHGLQEQSKQLKRDLQQLEHRIDSQIKEQDSRHLEQVTTLDERLTEQISDLDTRTGSKLQGIIKDLRSLEDVMRGELRQTIDEMDHAKMDRVALGELFAQLGAGLQSRTPETELTSLIDAIEQEMG
ncbi:MAG: hypothetical protein AAF702_18490 [Chloroflexota bacterium]